jgi:hypothetical protein
MPSSSKGIRQLGEWLQESTQGLFWAAIGIFALLMIFGDKLGRIPLVLSSLLLTITATAFLAGAFLAIFSRRK